MSQNTAVRPKDVCRSRFVGSPFGVTEMEMMLQCIAITQFKMNPDAWTPFTWEEYVAKCDHEPINEERLILEAMVSGDTVFFRGNLMDISAGYLRKEGGRYVVAEKLLDVMRPYAK